MPGTEIMPTRSEFLPETFIHTLETDLATLGFCVQVFFHELQHDQTRLVFKMIFDSAETCNKIKPLHPKRMKKISTGLKNCQSM